MSDLLRPNRVLDKLRGGEIVGCMKVNLSDPCVVQIAALCGFDCVWLDAEHVPNTSRDLENSVRAAHAHQIDAIVRVPRGSYTDLIRPLEMDAAGIMVPHVMSPQDARDIVRMTRFHPLGRRPLDGGNADGAFSKADLQAYIRHANTQKLIIAQIEDVEAVETLDQIAAVEGINMLFFGPGDFSQSLGCPGRTDDPRVAEARRRVAEAAARHGKFAGTVCDLSAVSDLVHLGYHLLNIGSDVSGLNKYFMQAASAFSQVNKLDMIASK